MRKIQDGGAPINPTEDRKYRYSFFRTAIIGSSVPLFFLVISIYFLGGNILRAVIFYILIMGAILILGLLARYFSRARETKMTDAAVTYKKGMKEYHHLWSELLSWEIVGHTVHAVFSNGDKVIFPEKERPIGKEILEKLMGPELIEKKKEKMRK